jgi:hypothetical protein
MRLSKWSAAEEADCRDSFPPNLVVFTVPSGEAGAALENSGEPSIICHRGGVLSGGLKAPGEEKYRRPQDPQA